MWLAGHCGMCGGEEKWIQNFWWRKLNERDRMEVEQIKSHVICKRTDPSVAKPYTQEMLIFSFTLRSLYPPRENLRYPKHKTVLSSSTEQGAGEKR